MSNERKKVRNTFIYLAILTTIFSLNEAYSAHLYYHADGYVINFLVAFATGMIFTLLICAIKTAEYRRLRLVSYNHRAILKTKVVSVLICMILAGVFSLVYFNVGYSGTSDDGYVMNDYSISSFLIALGILTAAFVAYVFIADIVVRKIRKTDSKDN